MSGKAGDVGELGYKEYDSRDFEKEKLETTEESAPAVEAETETAKDPEVEETATEDTAAVETTSEGEGAATPEASSEGSEKYEPNVTYRVYDQERKFPEWAQPLVKDKETEERFRDLLSKADGLDEMKPRHQQTVQERDQIRTELTAHKNDIARIVGLRQSNPDLFFAEVGVTDEMIVAAAKKIVGADTPEQQAQLHANRQAAIDAYRQRQQAEQVSQQASSQFMAAHNAAMEMALGHPEIKTFEQQFDRTHGIGAFRQQVVAHGNYQYQATGRNVSPLEAVTQVYEFHKKAFTAQPGASGGQPPPARPATPARPKALPNVGKGKNASPTQSRPRRLSDLRKYVEENVPTGEG